jgi:hypothetical protein
LTPASVMNSQSDAMLPPKSGRLSTGAASGKVTA